MSFAGYKSRKSKVKQYRMKGYIGKGKKLCISCSAIIGTVTKKCQTCGHKYHYKKRRPKMKKCTKVSNISRTHLNHKKLKPKQKQIHFTENRNTNVSNVENMPNIDKSGFTSKFIKNEPSFSNIEKRTIQHSSEQQINEYIQETQLLLDCANEQISFSDLNKCSNVLQRVLKNVTYLANICDTNDCQNNKYPVLNRFIGK